MKTAPEFPARPAVTGRSHVQLRRLAQRRDGNSEWVIGRMETGDFVSVPDVAHRVVDLLGQELTVDEVSARLRVETGTGFAVGDFVAALDGLGFVAAIDGEVCGDPARPKPSLPWLQPRRTYACCCTR